MSSRKPGAFAAVGGWWTIVAFVAAFAAGASLRLMEAYKWSGSALNVAGEKLMATHDAYAFLAGAKGTSRFANDPLSILVDFLSGITGLSLGTVGFWLPAFMAPLAALPICLVAGRLKMPEAGLPAGLMTVITGGFLLRSRIGYLDTDVFSLFFAVAAASGLFLWLYHVCRRGLLPAWDDPKPEEISVPRFWIWAVALGLFLKLYMVAYPSGKPIVWSIIGAGAVLGLLFSRAGNRMPLLVGLAMIISIWSYGWSGLVGSVAVIAVGIYDIELLRRRRLGLALACVFFGYFLFETGFGELRFIKNLVGEYLKFGAAREEAASGTTPMQLPNVMQSVREATNLQWADVKNVLSGNWALLIAGIIGALFAFVRFPLLIVFLPLLGLALASTRFGIRFTMYGGPVLGLGMAVAASELLTVFRQSEVRRWAVQIALAICILFTFMGTLKGVPAVPVLHKPYAQTFIDLKSISEEDAILWQWWDYGYAAQYYAERDTYGDGGRHDGTYLYPLGLVHTTNSPQQAAQVIKLMAAERKKLIGERIARGDKPDVDAVLDFYSIDPMANIGEMDPREAQEFIESLAFREYKPEVEIPEQYFVLAWDNMNLASWINRYGSWDLASGAKAPGHFSMLSAQAEFNLKRGLIRAQEKTAALSGMIMIMGNGQRRQFSWPNGTGLYVIAHRGTGQMYIMDDNIYNSMLVQMLLGDPTRFGEHFELVVDRSPWARAYRVK